MQVKMKPASVIKARLGIEPQGKAHAFFTAECARQMDAFVPFDKGNLAGSVIENGNITENVTTDSITYNQKYASVVYYGIRKGKPITIKTSKHSKATKYWDKAMWTAKSQDIIDAVQKYVETHGGN